MHQEIGNRIIYRQIQMNNLVRLILGMPHICLVLVLWDVLWKKHLIELPVTTGKIFSHIYLCLSL